MLKRKTFVGLGQFSSKSAKYVPKVLKKCDLFYTFNNVEVALKGSLRPHGANMCYHMKDMNVFFQTMYHLLKLTSAF